MASSASTLICHYCGSEQLFVGKFLRHLSLQHEFLPNFSVSCHICRKPYVKVESLRRHYYRKHKSDMINLERDVIDQHEANHDSDNFTDDLQNDQADQTVTTRLSLNDVLLNLQKHITLFVLNLQERHLLPSLVQETVVGNAKFILEEFWQAFSEIVSREVEKQSINISEGSDLHEIIYRSDLLDTIFAKCTSEFRLQKYCKTNLGAIFPNAHELPGAINGKKIQSQYIPILETLKQILSTEDIMSLLINDQLKPVDSYYYDYKSGSEFRNHSVFSHKLSLRIHLYLDEFEVVNPLGSKKSIHKLIGVYFTIGNLGPKFTTKLRHIYLCILCRNIVLQNENNTYQQILQPLINDLNKLATEGIAMDLNGSRTQIFGAVATVSADNLGAHQLGGFTKSFSTGRVCRFCMVLHSELADVFCERQCILRSKISHAHHIQTIRENPDLAKSTYGVLGKCPLEDLDYFSTVDNFVPDLMHDFLEGIVPTLIKLTLKHYHDTHIVSIKQVNEMLITFTFEANDKTYKPSQIPMKCVSGNEASLPGKAIEKWCLFRILPLLISQYIPLGDEHWTLYLKCRLIADLLFAPSLTFMDVEHLEILIPDFLEHFVELFPNRITPKFHYLLHYPTQIKKLGPLRHLWCMRFEGKHQYFKRLAHNLSNFRNVAFSLAKRHQLRLCWEFASGDFLMREAQAEFTESLKFSELTRNVQQSLVDYIDIDEEDIEEKENVLICKTLQFNTVKYAIKDCFIVDIVEIEEVPVFFKIFSIINFRSKWLLYGNIWKSNAFNVHLHSFEVDNIDTWCIVEAGQEVDYHALDMYTWMEKRIITLHHKPHKN